MECIKGESLIFLVGIVEENNSQKAIASVMWIHAKLKYLIENLCQARTPPLCMWLRASFALEEKLRVDGSLPCSSRMRLTKKKWGQIISSYSDRNKTRSMILQPWCHYKLYHRLQWQQNLPSRRQGWFSFYRPTKVDNSTNFCGKYYIQWSELQAMKSCATHTHPAMSWC